MPLPEIPHFLPRYVRDHSSPGMPKSGQLEGGYQIHLSIYLYIFVKCQLCAIHYSMGTEDRRMGRIRQSGVHSLVEFLYLLWLAGNWSASPGDNAHLTINIIL